MQTKQVKSFLFDKYIKYIFMLKFNTFWEHRYIYIGGSREPRSAHPSPSYPTDPNFLDFMFFWKQIGKIVCYHPTAHEESCIRPWFITSRLSYINDDLLRLLSVKSSWYNVCNVVLFSPICHNYYVDIFGTFSICFQGKYWLGMTTDLHSCPKYQV